MSKPVVVAKKQAKLVQAYKTVFESVEGRAVLADMAKIHHFSTSTFPLSGDVHLMLIKEGERAVILRILEKIAIDPKQLHERIKEYEKSMVE